MDDKIITGKWFFAQDSLTVTDPNGTTHQLEILGFTALRKEIAAVSITHSWGVYYVTERGIKVQEVEALRALPDPTPEQVARRQELNDWINADTNDLLHDSSYQEEL